MTAKQRIVIIGGGFAGVKCGRLLRSKMSESQCEIVVFNRENHMVFHPLLAEVAAAAISPKDMAAPLRQLLKKVHCRSEEVTKISLADSSITYQRCDGSTRVMKYDHLVIGGGSTTNLAVIPGMADHAFPFKDISDALAIQSQIISKLEDAESAESVEERRRCLTFVIVGGGFSGVELAGEINDLVKSSSKYYSNFNEQDVSVILIHSHEQILPEVSSSLRDFALNKMKQQGIKFLLGATASLCTAKGVGLEGGLFVEADTVICTIGTRALPLIEELDVPKLRGRIAANEDMSVPGYKNVWAVGDCAAIINAADKSLSPTTGQFAERQGAQVAKNIIRTIENKPTKPFFHNSLGTLCSIGGKSAVAEAFNFRVSGFLAWCAWRAVYLVKLPSAIQAFKIGIGWTYELIFPPQLTSVRVDASRRVGNARYAAGDFIFKKDDPAMDFYVIKQGEVEMLSADSPIALLVGGDFFGESALMDRTAHRNSARAKTDCEILVIGKNIFSQISETLHPLRDSLAIALKRRSSLFENFPEATEVVKHIPLKDLIQPTESALLDRDTLLTEVVHRMNKERLDSIYIVDGDQKLVGLVTKTDLMRWADLLAVQRNEPSLFELKVRDLMISELLTVTDSDETILALSIMREHHFKRLPVISQNGVILGVLRIENLMEEVIRRVRQSRANTETTNEAPEGLTSIHD